MHEFADRLERLPFYLYPTIDAIVNEAIIKGRDIIDISMGDPEFPTPKHIIRKLQESCVDPATHRYGSIPGYSPFRESIARWYERRFGVHLDSESEIVTFLGSKEGIAFLPLAFVNKGDVVLIPDPGYPTYRYAAAFANGEIRTFPLRPDFDYVPDFNEIPASIAEKAKIIFLNYPNNPTGATVTQDFFKRAVEFAQRYNIIICHDAAYSEVTFDGYKAPSLLEVDGAREVGVEVHSLSKTFCMMGWRVGFALGNSKFIKGLLEVKRVSSNGHFRAIEMAGIEALDKPPVELDSNNQKFKERRDFVVGALHRIGIDIKPPRGSFYVWFPIPEKKDSLGFVRRVILETGVVTFPGIGYGDNGEGYIRIAIVPELEKIKEAFKRLEPYLRS